MNGKIYFEVPIMKDTFMHSVILLCLSPFLVQCVATEKEMDSMGRHLRSVESRVVDVDQEIAALRSETVKEVQSKQAQTGNQLDRLQADIMKLQGQMEENFHQNRMIREENKQLEANLTAKLNNLAESSRAATLQQTARMDLLAASDERLAAGNEELAAGNAAGLAQLQERLARLDERIGRVDNAVTRLKADQEKEAMERAMEAADRAREAAARTKAAEAKAAAADKPGEVIIFPDKLKQVPEEATQVATAPPAQPAAQPPPAAAPATDPESDRYNKAIEHYKAKDYRQAHDAFAEFLKRHPGSNRAGDARYLLADSLFGQQQYEPAILEFQKVIIDHPQHKRVAPAYLKQGMAFEKLNDTITAAIIYKKIVDEYGDSEQADLARKRLEALK